MDEKLEQRIAFSDWRRGKWSRMSGNKAKPTRKQNWYRREQMD